MTQYLVAIHHPDDYDPSAEHNDEMAAASCVGSPLPALRLRSEHPRAQLPAATSNTSAKLV